MNFDGDDDDNVKNLKKHIKKFIKNNNGNGRKINQFQFSAS